jgi:hypothetical protein
VFKSYPVETLSHSPGAPQAANHNTDRPPVSVVGILTAEFEHEETRVGVRDLSDPAYPVLARSLRTRRENIRVTIASLEALVRRTAEAA